MADIQLSSQLFQDIQQAVQRQDPQADQGTVMQYLAAVMGYMLGSQSDIAVAERDAYLEDLCAFARHVYHDRAEQQQQQQQQEQPAAEALGYWEPPRH